MRLLHNHILKNPTYWTAERLPAHFRSFFRSYIIKLHLQALNKFEYTEKTQIRRFQLERLSTILRYAFKNVPFWQGFSFTVPNNCPVELYENFTNLPIITKTNLREIPLHMFKNLALPSRRFGDGSTSGSTGIPILYSVDEWSLDRATAQYFRVCSWFNIFDPYVVRIGSRDFSYAQGQGTFLLVRTTHDLSRHLVTIRGIAEKLNGKTLVIHTYPSYLTVLADLLRKMRKTLFIALAMSVGERFNEKQRQYIEDGLVTKTTNNYGLRETRNIASECEHKAMHLYADDFLLEVVDENGAPIPDGSWGRLIVTCFNNFVMPVIRYDTGDHGRIVPNICPCKRNLPIIEFEGRSVEFINLPDGKIIHPFAFTGPFNRRTDKVLHYQVVRTDELCFMVNIVPTVTFTTGDKNTIYQELQSIFGDSVTITMELVPSIAPVGGKVSHYVQHISK